MLRKIEGRRRRGRQRIRWLDGITDSIHMSFSMFEGQGNLACCHPWGWKESDTEQLNKDGWNEVLSPWCVIRVVAQCSRSEIDLAMMVSCRAERGTHLHVRSHVKWFQTRSSEPYRGLPRGQWGEEEWGFLPCSISARAAPSLSPGIPPKFSFAERIPWHHLIPVCLLH